MCQLLALRVDLYACRIMVYFQIIMGLTTQYHRYNASGICALVASGKCNVVWLEYGGKVGKYCTVGACENVIIWDVRTGEQVFLFCVFLSTKP